MFFQSSNAGSLLADARGDAGGSLLLSLYLNQLGLGRTEVSGNLEMGSRALSPDSSGARTCVIVCRLPVAGRKGTVRC